MIPGAILSEAADRLHGLGRALDFLGFICHEAKPVALYCAGLSVVTPSRPFALIKAGDPADVGVTGTRESPLSAPFLMVLWQVASCAKCHAPRCR